MVNHILFLENCILQENDSYEFTVVPKRYPHLYIDIFFMYYDEKTDSSWVGGMGNRGDKYRYDYPRLPLW